MVELNNVLSCFDGMSCGQIALNRAGIKYNKYFASEIDAPAMAVTQHHYPDTIQLGDIRNIKASDLPKIDLMLAGSPCQGFSFAGKQLNFDDPRSKLFFDFIRLRDKLKPKYFLLENVMMDEQCKNIISKYVDERPIMINSSKVAAQNRKRLYWTNIKGVIQPKDRGLVLADILEDGFVDRDKSLTLTKSYHMQDGPDHYFKKARKQIVFTDKCVMAGRAQDIKGHDSIKRVYDVSGKSPCLTTCEGGNREIKIYTRPHGYVEEKIEGCVKYPTVTRDPNSKHLVLDRSQWRKLTPLECERLQTVPDNWTLVPYKGKPMSNTQRYRMLGNGWTIDVIAHILKFIDPENRTGNATKQMRLF